MTFINQTDIAISRHDLLLLMAVNYQLIRRNLKLKKDLSCVVQLITNLANQLKY